MRCNFLVLTVAGSLALCGIQSNTNAQEDVYVDLSVLDGLQNFDSSDVATQPLFPQVKKSIPAAKLKPAAKIIKSKKVSKPKVKESKSEEIKNKPLSEAEQLALDDKKRAELVQKMPEVVEAKIEMEEEVYKVDDNGVSEIVASSNNEEKITIPDFVPEVSMGHVHDSGITQVPVTPIAKSESLGTTQVSRPYAPEVKIIDETIATVPSTTEESAVQEQPTLTETQVESLVEPIIPAVPAIKVVNTINKQIFFEADDAPLNDANKQRVDEILASFVDAHNNKIAILSYNLDDGQDVFKKKRLSLNRAIEVRKYLLEKDYKNFSIKVVNVVDEPNKKNLVEVEEIK